MNLKINDECLFKSIILEFNKSLDDIILSIFKEIKHKKYSTVEKKFIINDVYYKFIHKRYSKQYEILYYLFWEKITENEIEEKYINALAYVNNISIKSNLIKSKIEKLINAKSSIIDINDYYKEKSKLFNNYVLEKEHNKDNLQIIKIKDDKIKQFGLNYYFQLINKLYDKLNNYSHIVIIFDEEYKIVNKWEIISKISVFCENFRKEINFKPFIKIKNKLEQDLRQGIKNNKYINFNKELENKIAEFYSFISYGFCFKDLFISNDSKINILIMQKIEFSDDIVFCPNCFSDKVRSNSYIKLLQKSFECGNLECISKNRSLRGKRYTYLSAKLQSRKFYLKEKDYVPTQVYKSFRKDIFNNEVDILKNVIHLYTFTNENILLYDVECDIQKYSMLQRNIYFYESYLYEDKNIDSFLKLPIIQLMNTLIKSIKDSVEEYEVKENILIKNNNSTEFLYSVNKNQYDIAMTSPPYYNAREYSNWDNIILYFIDMIINAKYLYDKIKDNGYYVYNISDIVGMDNVYIKSKSCNRKQMLSSYSVVFFSLIGWNIVGNIIWDKGEVQSKRNLTLDFLPYYINPINCYENLYFFNKNIEIKLNVDKVKYICPVMKIGKGGKNLLGHTAPYPINLVENIRELCNENSVILDPYLGSGTTVLWAKENKYKCIGIEMNKD